MEVGGKDRPPMLAPETDDGCAEAEAVSSYGLGLIMIYSPPWMLVPMLRRCKKQLKGKDIAKASSPPSESEHEVKIYKPTNNNLKISSNTKNKHVENTLRTERRTGFKQTRIKCFNYKEFGHVAKEYKKAKRVKDSAYHKDKMLLFKKEEAGIQLTTEQHDWLHDSNDKPENQELEAHYMYMAKIQEVIPTADEYTRPVLEKVPLEKVHPHDEYNVFAKERRHIEHLESISDTYVVKNVDSNITLDSSDM
ncbi:hypothetical protein Tco_0812335 [Tanacetum coccineum]